MTDEHQKLLEEITKVVAEQFGAKYTLWTYKDKYKQHKKIVIEYAEQKG